MMALTIKPAMSKNNTFFIISLLSQFDGFIESPGNT
jgi:hypothetical protein